MMMKYRLQLGWFPNLTRAYDNSGRRPRQKFVFGILQLYNQRFYIGQNIRLKEVCSYFQSFYRYAYQCKSDHCSKPYLPSSRSVSVSFIKRLKCAKIIVKFTIERIRRIKTVICVIFQPQIINSSLIFHSKLHQR